MLVDTFIKYLNVERESVDAFVWFCRVVICCQLIGYLVSHVIDQKPKPQGFFVAYNRFCIYFNQINSFLTIFVLHLLVEPYKSNDSIPWDKWEMWK